MNPAHALSVLGAELDKLGRRATTWIGLLISLLAGFWGPFVVFMAKSASARPVDAPPPSPFSPAQPVFDYVASTSVAFFSRGFLFFPLVLFTLCALVFAGEHARKTLREDLLRPVPRAQILITKWLVICIWVLACVAITGVLSTLGGLIIFGTEGEWTNMLTIVARYALAEIAYAALALLIAVLTRSVAGTLGSLIVLYFGQIGLGMIISFGVNLPKETAMGQVPGVPEWAWDYLIWAAEFIEPWQPPAIVQLCCCLEPDPLTWQNTLSLAVVTAGSLLLAIWRFQKMDVP
jgi:ABC-type transport system involved in multi-copper enzyme maturation permease subunit